MWCFDACATFNAPEKLLNDCICVLFWTNVLPGEVLNFEFIGRKFKIQGIIDPPTYIRVEVYNVNLVWRRNTHNSTRPRLLNLKLSFGVCVVQSYIFASIFEVDIIDFWKGIKVYNCTIMMEFFNVKMLHTFWYSVFTFNYAYIK